MYFADTITIYCQIGTVNKPKYKRCILNDVYIEKSLGKRMTLMGNEANNSAILYIPYNVEGYTAPREFKKINFDENIINTYWSLQEGDLIVDGICAIDTIESITELKQNVNYFYVISHINNFLKNSSLAHWEVILK